MSEQCALLEAWFQEARPAISKSIQSSVLLCKVVAVSAVFAILSLHLFSMATVPPTEGHGAPLGRLGAEIMPHILNLYNCMATAADYEIYAPTAVFEDPLMQAHGVKQIKSAFYSVPKVFKEGRLLEYTVSEEETAPGSGEIRIDNKQQYKIAGKTIDVASLIKLQVENWKVVRHVDMWDKKPLSDRHTVKFPLVGRAAEKLRRSNMLITHLFMGFGKDPQPKEPHT